MNDAEREGAIAKLCAGRISVEMFHEIAQAEADKAIARLRAKVLNSETERTKEHHV
jgi:hypothetical protein